MTTYGSPRSGSIHPVRCQVSGVRCQVSVVTGGPEGFSVFLSWVGVLSVPSVATEPIIEDWHLAPVAGCRLSVVTGGPEGFSVSLGWVGVLSVPSVATDPIVEDWHLAPGTWHLLQGVRWLGVIWSKVSLGTLAGR